MYLKLPFRILFFHYTRRVKIILNIGVLEDICSLLSLEYHQLNDYIKTNAGSFTEMLLYFGYLAGCKESRHRPRYNIDHAKVWTKRMSVEESGKLLILMGELYGKLNKATDTSKKKS